MKLSTLFIPSSIIFSFDDVLSELPYVKSLPSYLSASIGIEDMPACMHRIHANGVRIRETTYRSHRPLCLGFSEMVAFLPSMM